MLLSEQEESKLRGEIWDLQQNISSGTMFDFYPAKQRKLDLLRNKLDAHNEAKYNMIPQEELEESYNNFCEWIGFPKTHTYRDPQHLSFKGTDGWVVSDERHFNLMHEIYQVLGHNIIIPDTDDLYLLRLWLFPVWCMRYIPYRTKAPYDILCPDHGSICMHEIFSRELHDFEKWTCRNGNLKYIYETKGVSGIKGLKLPRSLTMKVK